MDYLRDEKIEKYGFPYVETLTGIGTVPHK